MTSRREARLLLNSVEEARTKTRDALDPSYFDIGALLVAQIAAVLVAIGHTTDTWRDNIAPALIAAALAVCGVMIARAGSRLGAKIGIARIVVPIALFVTDVVINFTVDGQGELASRALALGVAAALIGAIARKLTVPAIGGVFAFLAGATALDWNAGLVISILAVALIAMVIVFRKDVFGIRV